MESIIEKTLSHAPELGALVLVVVLFLKHLEKRDVSNGLRTTEFIETVKQMHSEATAVQREFRAAITSNTEALSRNTVAMIELGREIKK